MKAERLPAPRVGPDEVAVFYALVPPLDDRSVSVFAAELRQDERMRADGFLRAADRHLFIASHWLMHRAITWALGHGRWQVRAGRHGKPELVAAGDPPLCFNLSHTSGLAVCALARGRAVGVDAETIDPGRHLAAMAQRYLAPCERNTLAACNPGHRAEMFTRFWTLKEAVLKALGCGLTFPLNEFGFRLDPPTLVQAPDTDDGTWWHLEEMAPTPSHRVALAVRRDPHTRLVSSWHAFSSKMIPIPKRPFT